MQRQVLRKRKGSWILWLVAAGLLVLLQAGGARAQLPCAAGSVASCAGKNAGDACESGFGISNCAADVSAQGVATCTCPDVDCTAPDSCFETKYGLGSQQDWHFLPDGSLDERFAAGDPTAIIPDRNTFVGSYGLTRGDGRSDVPTCAGPPDPGESGWITVNGTFILREQVGCDPFTEPGGCPVRQAYDLNYASPDNPPHFFSEARHIASNVLCGFTPPSTFHFCELFISVASAGTQFGVGHRVPNDTTTNAACTGEDTPQICCTGPGTGNCDADTKIVWDVSLGSPGGSASLLCCNSDAFDRLDLCDSIGGIGVAKYPLTPNLGSFGGPYKNFPAWEFDADPASPPFGNFEIDLDHVTPNQRYGVCLVNRRVACDCGVNGASCGAPRACVGGSSPGAACNVNADCPGGTPQAPATCVLADPCPERDADPTTAGLQPDQCDLLDKGYRLSPDDRLADGSPHPGFCAGTLYVFRGTPQRECLLSTKYEVNGDPGPDCSVRNFGPHTRPDLDCDGISDRDPDDDDVLVGGVDLDGPAPDDDLCPTYSEVDGLSDTNGDGRGDECNCGDTNNDGTVDVRDIVATNTQIFTPAGAGTWFTSFPYTTEAFRRILAPLADSTYDRPQDETVNADCVGNEDPYQCCTGPGTGTCHIDETILWNTGGDVNVSDVVQNAIESFSPLNSRCARSPVEGQ